MSGRSRYRPPLLFDRYVIVDWSASSRPRTGKDSVWICDLGADGQPSATNPATRRAAEQWVRDLLREAVGRGERVLVGFDFPYGYPRGLTKLLQLPGRPWSAIWDYLTQRLQDEETNRNNRFAVAAEINSKLPHQVFWGCPISQPFEDLSFKRDCVVYAEDGEPGLREWRSVESILRVLGHRPQATWKLMGNGSVGSQSLTGIPVVSRLRNDPVLGGMSAVWPFELLVPGDDVPGPKIVHAEIWPSLREIPAVPGEIKDKTQVTFLAEEYRRRDREGTLAAFFAAASSPAAAEEGWILGVE